MGIHFKNKSVNFTERHSSQIKMPSGPNIMAKYESLKKSLGSQEA